MRMRTTITANDTFYQAIELKTKVRFFRSSAHENLIVQIPLKESENERLFLMALDVLDRDEVALLDLAQRILKSLTPDEEAYRILEGVTFPVLDVPFCTPEILQALQDADTPLLVWGLQREYKPSFVFAQPFLLVAAGRTDEPALIIVADPNIWVPVS